MGVKKVLDITIDINTGIFQEKLRAISKHAEALADELDAIDAAECPGCRGLKDIPAATYSEYGVSIGQDITKVCPKCDGND